MNKEDLKQVERLMALPQYAGAIRERSFISPFRFYRPQESVTKTGLFENAPQTEGI